jgi:type I restriction enzyme S subunit
MSRIDDLIAEHCPDGVQFYELVEACTAISAGGDLPSRYAKGQLLPSDEYPYPIFSNGSGQSALYGFTDGYRIESKSVTISARGTIGYHAIREGKFTPIVRLITLCPNTELISAEYLNYVLDVTEIGHSGGSIPQLTVPAVKKICIPVPPLEVQREIVRVLDTFAELEAELEARRRQYAHYRDRLCNFNNGEGDVAAIRSLDEVCVKIVDCPHSTPKWTDCGTVVIRNHNIRNGNLDLTLSSFTDSSHYLDRIKRATPTEGDIIITREAPMGEVAMIPAQLRCCLGQRMVLLRPDTVHIHGRFLLHVLQSSNLQSLISLHNRSGSTVSNLKLPILRSLPIPVPLLVEQERIVGILDSFDALVKDLSIGLPAELAARRKQYEYYRDRLLTFEEKPA